MKSQRRPVNSYISNFSSDSDCLTGLLSEAYSTSGPRPSLSKISKGLQCRTLRTAEVGCITGRMPSLSPSQQCQSTECFDCRCQSKWLL